MPTPPLRKRPFNKRVRFTKQQELQLCGVYRSQPRMTYKALASYAHVEFLLAKPPSLQAISRVLKTEAVLLKLTPDYLARKKPRPRFQLELDQSLVEFVLWCEVHQISLSGHMLIAQARRLAEHHAIPSSCLPRFGLSWLRRFQERYDITWKRAHGSYPYTVVFNMDETGFFYNSVPRGSLCIKDAPSLKQDKARITLAVCTNVTGSDKHPLLFIGKSPKPRWIKDKPAAIQYTSTKKAWMTTDVFEAWLNDVNASMKDQGRKILMLVDNASSHCPNGVELSNLRLEKLPPNTTSKLQPLDQGIIYCLKRDVPTRKMLHALDEMDVGNKKPYKVGMLKGIQWCAEAWQRLPAQTIKHCWLHSGLISKADLRFVLN